MKFKKEINSFVDCYDFVVVAGLDFFGYEINFVKGCFCSTGHISEFDDKSLPVLFKLERGIPIREIINKIFGIQFEKIILKDDVIFSEIRKHPIILSTDSYDCYWSPLYHKAHSKHDIFLYGNGKSESNFRCIDVHLKQSGDIEISQDELLRLSKYNVNRYLLNEECSLDYVSNMYRLLDTRLKKRQENLSIEETQFKDIFLKQLKCSDIGNPQFLYDSALLSKLMWIAEDKKIFAEGLEYIDTKNKYVSFDDIYKLLEQARNYLVNIRNILIRYSIGGSLNANNLNSVISMFYNQEFLICDMLQKCIKRG